MTDKEFGREKRGAIVMLGTIKRHRRATAIVAGVAGTMMVSSIAWAYFTGGGGGEGNAAVGSNLKPLVVTQTTVTMSPEAPAQALAGVITNPNGTSVKAGDLSAKIKSVSAGTLSDFVIYGDQGSDVVPINQVIAPWNNSPVAWSGLWVSIVDKPLVNQDNLKGATVTIEYTLTAAGS